MASIMSMVFMLLDKSKLEESVNTTATDDLLKNILELVSNFATLGGGLWLLWGVVVLAGGMKDKNGPEMQSGIWQIVGGALIVAAATMFKSFTKT